jgi:hypothetical protein
MKGSGGFEAQMGNGSKGFIRNTCCRNDNKQYSNSLRIHAG